MEFPRNVESLEQLNKYHQRNINGFMARLNFETMLELFEIEYKNRNENESINSSEITDLFLKASEQNQKKLSDWRAPENTGCDFFTSISFSIGSNEGTIKEFREGLIDLRQRHQKYDMNLFSQALVHFGLYQRSAAKATSNYVYISRAMDDASAKMANALNGISSALSRKNI